MMVSPSWARLMRPVQRGLQYTDRAFFDFELRDASVSL
jgi:hypothetical protein